MTTKKKQSVAEKSAAASKAIAARRNGKGMPLAHKDKAPPPLTDEERQKLIDDFKSRGGEIKKVTAEPNYGAISANPLLSYDWDKAAL